MIVDDEQLGKPQILYNDTKANIEALIGLDEGSFAYATDTDEIGSYDGAAWTWATVGAGQYRQFVYVVFGGDFDFVIDVDGNPVMALEDLE